MKTILTENPSQAEKKLIIYQNISFLVFIGLIFSFLAYFIISTIYNWDLNIGVFIALAAIGGLIGFLTDQKINSLKRQLGLPVYLKLKVINTVTLLEASSVKELETLYNEFLLKQDQSAEIDNYFNVGEPELVINERNYIFRVSYSKYVVDKVEY